MPLITDISPEVLRFRHRLSPQQINMLSGTRVIGETHEEKAEALLRVAEFLRLADFMTDAGAAFVPLKGPLLSQRLYGDPTVRYSHDLDILVKPEDIEKAIEVLETSGYRQIAPLFPEDLKGKVKRVKYNHHLSFIHSGHGQIVELHWRLANKPWLRFTDTERVVNYTLAEYNYAGRKFMVLGPELELLYLVIHGGAHHWGRLKWIVDVHRFLNTISFSESRFTDLSGRLKAGRLVGLCNYVLTEFFPAASLLPCSSRVPSSLVQSVHRAISGDDYRGPETVGEILGNLRYAMRAYQGLDYKARLLLTITDNSLFAGRLSRIG